MHLLRRSYILTNRRSGQCIIDRAKEKSTMTDVVIATNEEIEARVIRLAERPIRFTEFLDLNVDSNCELIAGVMVEKMAAQWEHERLIVWLSTLLHAFTQHKGLGVVAVSRMTVRIDEFHSRLPDLFFVRQDRIDLIRQRAVYGPPDLVIELISPHDRPSDRIALEADYRAIGVPEIVFIDQQKRRVTILRQRDNDYPKLEMTTGALDFATIPGFTLQIDWLFNDTRPDTFDLLRSLLNEPEHPVPER